MQLSQAHLTGLERCPRQFQHTYIDHLAVLPCSEQTAALIWGQQFHLRMQQKLLGLPLPDLDDPGLQAGVTALWDAIAGILNPPESPLPWYQAEHRRLLPMTLTDGRPDPLTYWLTVGYDLLVMDPNQAHILDWKTYSHPPDPRQLAQHWQTRLYLFVLAETTDYTPEQLTMSYWMVPPGTTTATAIQFVPFVYSTVWHERTRTDLHHRLKQLTQWREAPAFPQVAFGSEQCRTCPFAIRCERRADLEPTPLTDWFVDLETVPEMIP